MSKKTYCVLGATGQVGRVVAEQLYRKGHHVKAIGRHPQKLDFLKSQGLEIVRVEGFDKKHFLNEAFKGADGVFCMLPPGQGVDDFPAYQDSVGEAIKEAIEKNNIKCKCVASAARLFYGKFLLGYSWDYSYKSITNSIKSRFGTCTCLCV
jgi:uncharacterized protein YbjT (DUF2867 family)